MRKKRVYKKYYQADTVFGRVELGRFINYVMKDGKKSTAEKLSSLLPDSLPSVQCSVKELLAMPGKLYGDFKNQVLKEIRARAAR